MTSNTLSTTRWESGRLAKVDLATLDRTYQGRDPLTLLVVNHAAGTQLALQAGVQTLLVGDFPEVTAAESQTIESIDAMWVPGTGRHPT